MITAWQRLETNHLLTDEGRVLGTREPHPATGPAFTLTRTATEVAWAVHVDVDARVAREIASLADDEPPVADFDAPPLYAERYQALIAGPVWFGPSFTFPASLDTVDGVTEIDQEESLTRRFLGWQAGEIAAGRAPVMAVVEDRDPVSVCFSARRSDVAAEAGVETAEGFRRRGYASRAVTGWATAIREEGLVPLYGTSWENEASRGVAAKLGLILDGSSWAITPWY